MKIEELEMQLEQELSKLSFIPDGYKISVSLTDQKGRKKRKDASADNWSPTSGEIRISFHPGEQKATPSRSNSVSEPQKQRSAAASNPISDFVRALAEAESRPGYQFVALKWFRDVFLPGQGLEWAQSETARQAVLREAIERHLVLTSKVPNPKSPQFPVTAIRLNRLLPEMQSILGLAQALDAEFEPVEIRGDSLSATVLRERR